MFAQTTYQPPEWASIGEVIVNRFHGPDLDQPARNEVLAMLASIIGKAFTRGAKLRDAVVEAFVTSRHEMRSDPQAVRHIYELADRLERTGNRAEVDALIERSPALRRWLIDHLRRKLKTYEEKLCWLVQLEKIKARGDGL